MTSKKSADTRQGVGFGFWMICLVIFLPGCVYLIWNNVYDNVAPYVRFFAGFLLAMFLSAIFAWIVNSAYQYVLSKRRKATRKKKKRK